MRTLRFLMLMLGVFSVAACADDLPKGMEPIFKKVESGKRFHPLWPPIVGQQVLGTVVIADKPNQPQAFFQTIDSPAYRNPSYKQDFIIGEITFFAPDFTQQKNIDAGVAFKQLDDIAGALQSGAQAKSLLGKGTSQDRGSATGASSTSNSSPNATGGGGESSASSNSGGVKPGVSQQPSDKSSSNNSNDQKSVTGIDFNRFTDASVKVTGLKVIYYDLPTIIDIDSNHALTAGAEQLLSKQQKGWIIHRALVVDSLEYTLTSKTAIDGGFFAKLVAWIPTVSVKYKNDKTVTLKTTSPLTIGYKLWQRGTGVAGQALDPDIDISSLGISAETIDSLLTGQD